MTDYSVIHTDCLEGMQGMEDSSVDLIYLDPPFNTGRNYSGIADSKAEDAFFADTWRHAKNDAGRLAMMQADYPALHGLMRTTGEIHGIEMQSYLEYMSARLMEMYRLLKDTGSIYLHIDPTSSHYLKLVMDCLFGREHFRNEIVWCYSNAGRSKNTYCKKHDIILFYSKTDEYTWTGYRAPSEEGCLTRFQHTDDSGRRFQEVKMNGKSYIYYEDQGMLCNDWWLTKPLNPVANERLGYPTQKPVALLHRIIQASSNVGDVVLDPFCGSGTTLAAAIADSRNAIGMDVSETACKVANDRLKQVQPGLGI